MFQDEKDIEADKIALENSRVQFFGASGADFSPDGRHVAVGNREMIWVADTVTHETKARLSYLKAARFGGSKSLQFVDNQRLVVGADGAIFIWDFENGLVTHRLGLTSRMFSPRALTWSESTQMLAFSTGVTGSSIKLVPFDGDGFGVVREFPGFEGVPADLQFSRDGRYLAAAGDDAGVSIREIETGQPAGELPTEGFVNNLELFGGNRLLVAGADVALWTFMDEIEALEFENSSLQGQVTGQVMVRVGGGIALGTLAVLAFSLTPFIGPELGFYLGSATYAVASAPVETSQRAWCGRSTTINPDGRWLADVYPGITSEIIRVYDLESGVVVRRLNPRGDYSCAVKFSPNGEQLLITTNKVTRLYDTKTWSHNDLKLK